MLINYSIETSKNRGNKDVEIELFAHLEEFRSNITEKKLMDMAEYSVTAWESGIFQEEDITFCGAVYTVSPIKDKLYSVMFTIDEGKMITKSQETVEYFFNEMHKRIMAQFSQIVHITALVCNSILDTKPAIYQALLKRFVSYETMKMVSDDINSLKAGRFTVDTALKNDELRLNKLEKDLADLRKETEEPTGVAKAGTVLNLSDDLKANFRSWEHDRNNVPDAEKLSAILKGRHPEVPYNVLRAKAFEWLGVADPLVKGY